jgi:uncharacterized membrane protein YdfJ with MMPL/SSD domain
MLIVVVCSTTTDTGQIQEVGVELFVTVLAYTTLVRRLLVLATTALLGRAGW